MERTTHPFDREEVMAYLDGELSPERASAAAAHLETCTECRALVAELRAVSREMAEWPVEMIPARVGENVMRAAEERGLANTDVERAKPTGAAPRRVPWLVWGGASAVAALLVLAISVHNYGARRADEVREATGLSNHARQPSQDRPQSSTYSNSAPAPAPPASPVPTGGASADRARVDAPRRSVTAPTLEKEQNARSQYAQNELDQRAEAKDQMQAAAPTAQAPSSNAAVAARGKKVAAGEATAGPMIIRRASMSLLTKEFDAARASLENLVKAHGGYFGQLEAASPADGGRALTATLRVPAAQLDAVLVELRRLGQVLQENQSADDITSQYVDLTARLSNARETEKRLVEILRERTGRVSDVLEVEGEIAATREQIEQMDAQRKSLETQVQYASVDLQIKEEYKQSLERVPAPSLGTRINNAAVGGMREAAETIIGWTLWFLGSGPTLLLWTLVLGWPAWKAAQWARRLASNVSSGW